MLHSFDMGHFYWLDRIVYGVSSMIGIDEGVSRQDHNKKTLSMWELDLMYSSYLTYIKTLSRLTQAL